MRALLVWTLFPGGWAVTGPLQVTAQRGGSLAVSCSYEPGYELYSKFWCRLDFLWFCFTYMAQTAGSEAAVTRGRVSIRDNHTAHSFTVTMGGITPGDAGWYSCGVAGPLLYSLQHATKVLVSAAVSATTEASTLSSLSEKPPCTTGYEEPPVLYQLDFTHLLLLLSLKVPVVLALVCMAVWVRNLRRGCSPGGNLQLSGVAGSAGASGSLPAPTAPEHRPVPLPHTLLGPSPPSRSGSCSAPGTSPPAKPKPLPAPPKVQRGGFGVQRACVC